jgi:subtilisin family serine protease
LNTVASALKAHAAESQKNVIAALAGVEHHVLWISNEIFVPAANAALVEKLAAIEGIAEIHEEYIMHLDQPIDIKSAPTKAGVLAEQNIERIQAHLVWSQLGNTGVGAVVANIDTGVRPTHETLRGNFLSDYGWFDPVNSAQIPTDENGHGTHVMGILAGGLGIGVAPGAKWMACRGCGSASCSQGDLTRCAQFVACPTRPDGSDEDCSKAPHVVSNSWGGGQGNPWFNDFIEAWHAAGVIPVFANGNSGPGCGSSSSPADSIAKVIAVGATTIDDSITASSSMGPSVTGLIKPDIVAPGQAIRSASNAADDAYNTFSGTSMAAPHVAGVIGLLAVAKPDLDLTYERAERFLYPTTERQLQGPGSNCGGIPENVFPNNAFGWGRLNALRAVQAAVANP